MQGLENIAELAAHARTLGASAVEIISAEDIHVEERLAEFCRSPHRCPSYGLSPGCPPHAMQPAVFREMLQEYSYALVFKIDASISVLLGPERVEVARTIHLIAATIEQAACKNGFVQAKGLAAGSCKELYCQQEDCCLVLSRQAICPHVDKVRPSLSAVGVNFQMVTEKIGWKFDKLTQENSKTNESTMGLMAGIVLLG